METKQLSQGGFEFPLVYTKAQHNVEHRLLQGEIDYADLTKWTFPDEFLCFVLETGLLEFIDDSYPTPREVHEVPIWFLITCQFLMRLHQTGKYSNLRYLLNAGSILTRFGYNVGSKDIGFNFKNKKKRKTVIHDDTVRKFFKDTKPKDICAWYARDLQHWFHSKQAFNHLGLFILDQSHLVVPDNANYKHAVKMPVDEHGQLYSNLGTLTKEQKQSLIYHPCYALSTLLNLGPTCDHYHIAGYALGAGNVDELEQAEIIVPNFCRALPGVMKELIVDRGYIDGEFLSRIKRDHKVDSLLPLRKNMSDYQDAIDIALHNDKWEVIECIRDETGDESRKVELALVKDMNLWDKMSIKQQVVVSRESTWNDQTEQYDQHYFVLATTKRYKHAVQAIQRYKLRVQTEERFRQFKHGWHIGKFSSPNESLIESHVCFTLFTYSLLQLYLNRKDLQEHTGKMIDSLRTNERIGVDAVLVYADQNYGVFDLDDYTAKVAGMNDNPRQKLKKTMEAQKAVRLKREA